jgi:hypothetical protein
MIPAARRVLAIALAVLVPALSGCASHNHPASIAGESTHLSNPRFDPNVLADCDPPLGWIDQPLQSAPDNVIHVWHSPTGDTAYGVIHFKMPLPAGGNLALSGFMAQMTKREGTAKLLEKRDDANLPGIRFVAEGKLHSLRGNLIVRGWEGWAIYAGTRTDRPINSAELSLAIAARERTAIGKSE